MKKNLENKIQILLMSSHITLESYDCPHIGLYRLKYLANSKGHKCDVFDSSLVDIDTELKKTNPSNYDIIGISVSHNEMENDLSIIGYLTKNKKGNKPLIIAGGQEATHNGGQWLREGVDLIFTGCAEEAFCDALDSFSYLDFNKAISKIKNLDGIMYLENDFIFFNPNKPLSLERFRKNNHDLVLNVDIPYEKYWEKARRETRGLNLSKTIFIPETTRLYTSSSCPYNCGFCNSSGFISFSQQSKHKPLRLNAEQIYEQILHHINKYQAKCFLFNDDEPLVDKKRINELCQKVIEAKDKGIIDKEVLFNSQGRVTDFLNGKNKSVDYGFINNISKMGFHSIGLGVETFSDRLLTQKSMNKRGYNNKQSLDVIYSMLKGGIIPHVFTILFIPEANLDDIKITIKKGMEVFRKGGEIFVNPLIRVMPGAPIYNNPSYLFKTKTLESKISGNKLEISKDYIPWDPFLADCADKVRGLIDEEISKFEDKWRFGKIPKSMLGTLSYIATAKLLKDSSLVKEGYKLIDDKIKELEERLSYIP